MIKRAKIVLLLCLACCLLSACSNKSDSVKYYLLEAPANPLPGKRGEDPAAAVIGLGPVTFPDYLARSQVVIRGNSTEVSILNGHRWAEPLEENFIRVLTQNLLSLNTDSRIIVYPSRQWSQVRRQVLVDVNRFDSDSQGRTILEAQLTLIQTKDPANAVSHSSRLILENSTAENYAGMVKLMGRLVYQLAEQITLLIGYEKLSTFTHTGD